MVRVTGKKNGSSWTSMLMVGMTGATLLAMAVWYNNLIPDDYLLLNVNTPTTTATSGGGGSSVSGGGSGGGGGGGIEQANVPASTVRRNTQSATPVQLTPATSQQQGATSSTSRSLKEWRQKVNDECRNAKGLSDLEKVTTMNSEIFMMPSSVDNVPAQPRDPDVAVRRCEHVVMDFGANIGDTSAHVVDSGLVACDQRRSGSKSSSSSGAKFSHFNVETKKFEVIPKLNPLTHHLIRMMKQQSTSSNTIGPEDYCYYGVEGNPVFTERLQKIEDYVMSITPRPIQHMHFFTESVGAGQDGMTKLYLDTVNTEQNFWGSSIFSGHQDVRKSSGTAADVMGYTIGTLMRKTLKAFAPDATDDDKKGNHLVLKVDIEGGEYPLLYQAGNEDDTLCEFIRMGNTADLFIEFHSQRVTGKHDYIGKIKTTRKKLEDCGVNFRNLAAWWA